MPNHGQLSITKSNLNFSPWHPKNHANSSRNDTRARIGNRAGSKPNNVVLLRWICEAFMIDRRFPCDTVAVCTFLYLPQSLGKMAIIWDGVNYVIRIPIKQKIQRRRKISSRGKREFKFPYRKDVISFTNLSRWHRNRSTSKCQLWIFFLVDWRKIMEDYYLDEYRWDNRDGFPQEILHNSYIFLSGRWNFWRRK